MRQSLFANFKHMRKGQTKGEKGLSKPVRTRLSKMKYAQIERLVLESKGETVSSITRKIVEDRPIKVFRHDESLDLVMEELAANRAEIKKIGVNINQMAKLFNSYPDLKPKVFFAKNGYERFLQLEIHIDKLLTKVEELAHRWLSE
ncbi:MAG: plasmid mobilization relaxosome protein MobC [Sediminibacterium sp.]